MYQSTPNTPTQQRVLWSPWSHAHCPQARRSARPAPPVGSGLSRSVTAAAPPPTSAVQSVRPGRPKTASDPPNARRVLWASSRTKQVGVCRGRATASGSVISFGACYVGVFAGSTSSFAGIAAWRATQARSRAKVAVRAARARSRQPAEGLPRPARTRAQCRVRRASSASPAASSRVEAPRSARLASMASTARKVRPPRSIVRKGTSARSRASGSSARRRGPTAPPSRRAPPPARSDTTARRRRRRSSAAPGSGVRRARRRRRRAPPANIVLKRAR